MTPQDDLPAERAATDMYNRLFSVMRLPEHEQHAKARLKLFYQVTRQDALREARETVLAEVLEDIPNNEADEAYNMAIGHAAHALDRLASEGG